MTRAGDPRRSTPTVRSPGVFLRCRAPRWALLLRAGVRKAELARRMGPEVSTCSFRSRLAVRPLEAFRAWHKQLAPSKVPPGGAL